MLAYPDHFADQFAAWDLLLPVLETLHPVPAAFRHHTRVVERSDAMFLTYPENHCLYEKETERATDATEMMRGQWASDLQELKFRHPEFYKLMLEEGQATHVLLIDVSRESCRITVLLDDEDGPDLKRMTTVSVTSEALHEELQNAIAVMLSSMLGGIIIEGDGDTDEVALVRQMVAQSFPEHHHLVRIYPDGLQSVPAIGAACIAADIESDPGRYKGGQLGVFPELDIDGRMFERNSSYVAEL